MKQQAATGVNSRKKVAQALKETVCNWLGWDELEYGDYMYETGLRYLRFYMAQDRWGQQVLERSHMFWNWWKSQWSARDAAFCDTEAGNKPPMSTENLRRLYWHLHDPAILACDIYPGRVVLEESYNQMISDLFKQEVHA